MRTWLCVAWVVAAGAAFTGQFAQGQRHVYAVEIEKVK
jgi:hypothetical protein